MPAQSKKSDLLAMLGLDDVPADVRPSGPAAKAGKSAKASSDTALKLDQWSRRRGADLLESNIRVAGLDLGGDDATKETCAADLLAAAYEPKPKLTEACVDKDRYDFVTQLLGNDDYQALHRHTVGDEFAAELAAEKFAEAFAKVRAADEASKKPGKPGDPKKSAEDAEIEREATIIGAVQDAVSEAADEVEAAKDAAHACGMGAGGSGGPLDPARVAALYKKVRENEGLRLIFEYAGRFRRLAQARQRQKSQHGYDDLIGVTLDNDIGQLVPSEMALLAIPEMEDELLLRLVQNQARCREYQGMEPVGKGPVIIVVDESGSMGGEKIYQAKALALAMAWIARHQRRWFAFVAYSGDTGHRILVQPPGVWHEDKILDWLDNFLSAGSNMDVPIREMPAFYEAMKAPRGQTDLLFLTDAICHVSAPQRDTFLAWKKQAQCKLTTILIGNHGSSQGDSLAEVSDTMHKVQALTADTDAALDVVSI